MNRNNFEDILNICLDRVLNCGESIEKCLADYPEQAAELKSLLQVALAGKKAASIQPRFEFKERARYQFQAAIRDTQMKKPRRFFLFQPGWATTVAAIVLLVVASSGTVLAAGNSMPDQPLYPVKLVAENVKLQLTFSQAAKAEEYANLADERVGEIVYLANKNNPAGVEEAASRMNTYLTNVALIAEATGSEENLTWGTAAPGYYSDAEITSQDVPASAPAPMAAPQTPVTTRPGVDSPVSAPPPTTTTTATATPTEHAMGIASVPPPDVTPTVPAPTILLAPPPGGAKSTGPESSQSQVLTEGNSRSDDSKGIIVTSSQNQQNNIYQLVSFYYINHQAELRKALEEAKDESVKEALRKALEISQQAYEKALQATAKNVLK